MQTFQLLDCTLRDGGYYNNWNYSPAILESYFKTMPSLPIDFVEIGYRSTRTDRYLGELFYTPQYILEQAAEWMPGIQKAIMLDEKDSSPDSLHQLLHPCKGLIQLVRLAVAPEQLERALLLAARIREQGMAVALNVMYASRWQENTAFLQKLGSIRDIDYLYLVDSLGAMQPAQLQALLRQVKNSTGIPLGFHGHNNLELALSNSLTAIQEGCRLIDVTVTGMGRGAGNLKTELLLTVLNGQFSEPVDFDQLAVLTETFQQLKNQYKWGTNLAYMLAGKYSIPQQEVMSQMNKRRYSISNIIQRLSHFLPGNGQPATAPGTPLSSEPATSEAILTGGGTSTLAHLAAFEKLVAQKQQSGADFRLIHSSCRFANVFALLPLPYQYFCLSGNEAKRLQAFPQAARIAAEHRFILPTQQADNSPSLPEGIQQVYQASPTDFAAGFNDSPLALAIQAACDLKASAIYLYGFDGYISDDRPGDIELFHENQRILDSAAAAGIRLFSLTPTRYAHIEEVSLFRFLQ